MSSYNFFAQYYDILTSNIPYQKRGEYFVSILKKHKIKSGKLLDLACGTGTLSVFMAQNGFNVTGVDLSEDMLSVAESKNTELENPVFYLCQPMQDLTLPYKVDACICALDSLNHLIKTSDVYKTFLGVFKHLNKDGIFIFDVNTVYKHREVLNNNTFVYDMDDVYCVWQNTLLKKDIVNINLDIFSKNKDGLFSKETENFYERAYETEKIESLLNKAGMKVVGCYMDDSFKKPNDKCQRLVFVAKPIY